MPESKREDLMLLEDVTGDVIAESKQRALLLRRALLMLVRAIEAVHGTH